MRRFDRRVDFYEHETGVGTASARGIDDAGLPQRNVWIKGIRIREQRGVAFDAVQLFRYFPNRGKQLDNNYSAVPPRKTVRVWYNRRMIASQAFSKVYTGRSVKGRKEVTVRDNDGSLPLRCLDFCTPTFAWGYHGGAPNELAIAILHDHLGSNSGCVEPRVLALYHAFAHEIVAKFAHGGAWTLPEDSVAKWVVAHEVKS
jgi:hypothetical protein